MNLKTKDNIAYFPGDKMPEISLLNSINSYLSHQNDGGMVVWHLHRAKEHLEEKIANN